MRDWVGGVEANRLFDGVVRNRSRNYTERQRREMETGG